MTLFVKKTACSVFVTAFLLLFTCMALLNTSAKASEREELQEQIDSLLETIADLKSQLDASGEAGSPDTNFVRNLALGDSGPDVKQLQIRLNQDDKTRVASFGPGSSGNETTYFGQLTKDAVKRYQELYRNEILAPVGLAFGTGYLGPSTREHLNASLGQRKDVENNTNDQNPVSLSPNPISSLNSFLSDYQEHDELFLSSISDYAARRGDRISISGIGFTKEDNTVHLGEQHNLMGLSSSGTRVSFTIPESIGLGYHSVSVSNKNGASDDNLFLVIYAGAYTPPTVTSVSPSEGLYGEAVTIKGTNFTREGNQVRASYGLIEDLESPDGETLTFQVRPPVEGIVLEDGVDLGQDIEIDYYFYVVNDNGFSKTPASFTGKI